MDPAAMIVVLIVRSGDLGDASTSAMTRTVQDALDGRAIVLVRDGGQEGLADPAAAKLGGSLHADVVALVTWSHPDHANARIHLYKARDSMWVDRTLSFVEGDPPVERGNMLGFEVAAMVPSSDTPPEPAPPRSPPEPPRAPVEHARRTPIDVDLAASAASGIGGPAGGVGALAAVRVRLTDAVALRADAAFRVGDMPAANAATATVRLAVGAATRVFVSGGERPFALGVRLDLLGLRHSVTSNDAASSGARWLPGVDAAAEGAWMLAPALAAVGAIGVEVAAGTTRVYVNDRRAEVVPPFRLVAELGARVSF